MVSHTIWLVIPAVLFSIIILRESFRNRIDAKSIRHFLSFFLLGLVLSFYAGAIVFEIFFDPLWVTLELAILLNLIWIFVDIWRRVL